MIRFSAFLVVVAVGLLVAGVVTSKLLFVYIAIGVSGVALLALGIGAAVNWRELSGKSGTAELTMAETSAQGPAPAPPQRSRSRPLRLQHRPWPRLRRPSPGFRAILAQRPPRRPPERLPPRPAGRSPPRQSRPVRPGPVTCPPPSRRREPSPRRPRHRPPPGGVIPPHQAVPPSPVPPTFRVPRPRSPRAARPRRPVYGSGATTRSQPRRRPPPARPLPLARPLPPARPPAPARPPRSAPACAARASGPTEARPGPRR